MAARGHIIEFAGASWVKMNILAGGAAIEDSPKQSFGESSIGEEIFVMRSLCLFKGSGRIK